MPRVYQYHQEKAVIQSSISHAGFKHICAENCTFLGTGLKYMEEIPVGWRVHAVSHHFLLKEL